jgi:hypothetical protein
MRRDVTAMPCPPAECAASSLAANCPVTCFGRKLKGSLRARCSKAHAIIVKVFWFCFSKKDFLLAFLASVAPLTAQAADLGQADGFDIRWDTTVRETLGFRTEDANPSLLANINGDDGDRAFRAGLLSARLDVFSEVTGERGDLGFDVSAQGWYDPIYYQRTADTSPQTCVRCV